MSNASTNWLLAFVALGIILVCNVCGKGMIKIIPILLGVVGAYVLALILHAFGVTNPDGTAILDFSSAAACASQGFFGFANLPDFRNNRNLLIAALIMVTGLGFTDGVTFTIAGTSITLTALALAAIVGIVANAVLPGRDYDYKEEAN